MSGPEVVFQRLNIPHIAFVPGLYEPGPHGEPLTETLAFQRLVVFAVRGLYSQVKRPLELHEIFQRVVRMVTAEISGKRWLWHFPLKRTVDRRVNEVASTDPADKNCTLTKDGKPQIVMWKDHPGWYHPNPDVHPDVGEDMHSWLEASR